MNTPNNPPPRPPTELADDDAIEPYRPFFLSGLMISVLGVLMWFLFQIGWLRFYPQQVHAQLMVTGFLFAYICGFLMTAIPKMTGTWPASVLEVSFGLAFLWAQVAFLIRNQMTLALIAAILLLASTVLFLIRRFLARTAIPPRSFIFVPIGFLAAIFGMTVLLWKELNPNLPDSLVILGKNFLYQGFVLNLILGLGSRLIPALSRTQGSVDVRAAMNDSVKNYIFPMLIFNLGFVVEAFYNTSIGNFIKFAVVVYFMFKKFQVFQPMVRRGYLGFGLKFAVIMIASGLLGAGLFPEHLIHEMHLTYVAGIGLLTILISTRVTLAHGGQSLDAEIDSPALKCLISVFLVAATFRAAVGYFGILRSELIYASVALWIIGLVCWANSFLKFLTGSPTASEKKSSEN